MDEHEIQIWTMAATWAQSVVALIALRAAVAAWRANRRSAKAAEAANRPYVVVADSEKMGNSLTLDADSGVRINVAVTNCGGTPAIDFRGRTSVQFLVAGNEGPFVEHLRSLKIQGPRIAIPAGKDHRLPQIIEGKLDANAITAFNAGALSLAVGIRAEYFEIGGSLLHRMAYETVAVFLITRNGDDIRVANHFMDVS